MIPFPNLLVSAAAASSTWNPLDKASTISLSSDKLTATGDGSQLGTVRATKNRSSGKYIFEVLLNSSDRSYFGFATSADTIENSRIGISGQSIGYDSLGGRIVFNGNNSATNLPASTTNDVISCAVDFSAGKFWFAKNGTWLGGGDPAAGTGGYAGPTGAVFPAVSVTSNSLTGRFSSGFSYAPPSGFSIWG